MKTVITMVALGLMLLPIPPVVNQVAVALIVLSTLYSGVEYFVQNKDALKEGGLAS